jgi:hypothetical protein
MGEYGFNINRPFYIKSRMTFRRVLVSTNGSNVQIRTRQQGNYGQMWVFDNVSKTIKSKKWTNKSLQFHGGWLYVRPTNSRHYQMFRYVNGNIVGVRDKRVFDVSNYSDTEGRRVGFYRRHNKSNQQWDIVYADEWKADPKKGELNTDFNLIVEKPFYAISGLGSGKYLDILGRNMVIKTRNGRQSQLWYFDQSTRTIKSMQHKGWSWDIRGSGRSGQMQAWNTNSRWW